MHELLDWVYSIAIALVLAMIIHIFVFVPTRVSGESIMDNTLLFQKSGMSSIRM